MKTVEVMTYGLPPCRFSQEKVGKVIGDSEELLYVNVPGHSHVLQFYKATGALKNPGRCTIGWHIIAEKGGEK